MKGRLKDRTAVITGASKGLGKTMALALAAEGARIALVSRDEERLRAAADEISAAGGEAAVFPADVTSEEEVRRIEREILAVYPKVNILINNAGVNVRKPVVDFTLEEWRRVMDTNVTAAFLLCRSFIPAMTGQGYGRILNMTSIMSHVSLPGRIAYSASKTALLGMTRTLALELAPEAITVQRHQSRSFRHGDESGVDGESGDQCGVYREHPAGAMGQGGGDRAVGGLPVFRRGGLHYGDGHRDRRRLDGTVRQEGWPRINADEHG